MDRNCRVSGGRQVPFARSERRRANGWRGAVAAVLLSLAVLSPNGAAADDGQLLSAQRDDFLAAKRALESGDKVRYRALSKRLGAYPLAPYLVYWEQRGALPRMTRDQVHELLAQLTGTPLEDRLRQQWLALLALRGRWSEYVEDYRSGNTRAECRYYDALRRLGRFDEAWRGAQRLWLVGKSQPDACDPLFAAWRAAGQLDPELVWQRITLAMERRQLSLAGYLGRLLEPDEQAQVELLIAVHRDPKRHLDDRRLRRDGAVERRIVLHGMHRLARRDPQAAERLWPTVSLPHAFTGAQSLGVARQIALEYAYDNDPRALVLMAALPQAWRDDEVAKWAVRTALRNDNWQAALEWLEQMSPAQGAEPRWTYWRGRMLAENGQPAGAEASFRRIAGGRGYYEFLAADRLGEPYLFGHVPAPDEPTLSAFLSGNPAFVRARELYFAGLTVAARREWYQALDGQPDEVSLVAGRLASHWGWHDRAIFALGAAGYYDDLEIRFPLAYRDSLAKQALLQQLEPAWVFAVARQESAFAADARSPVGALGLMQIMPATGRQIAGNLKTRLTDSRQLLQPERNLRFGTFYLRQLLDQHDRHPVLANAAYNAGPNRVRAWRPDAGRMPADIWIETVPFRETRNYLQRVLTYTAIYQQRLGQPVTRLSDRMRPVGSGVAQQGGGNPAPRG